MNILAVTIKICQKKMEVILFILMFLTSLFEDSLDFVSNSFHIASILKLKKDTMFYKPRSAFRESQITK